MAVIDGPAPMSDSSPLGAALMVTVKVRGRSFPPQSVTQGRRSALFTRTVSCQGGGFCAAADVSELAALCVDDVTFTQSFHSLLTVTPLVVSSVLNTVV